MSDELKPCPFCNGKAKVYDVTIRKFAFVYCDDCRARTSEQYNTKIAIELWNTRSEMLTIEAIKKQERRESYQYLLKVANESEGGLEFVEGIKWAAALFKPLDL